MNYLFFITGGAKSGKSLFAERLSLEIHANTKSKKRIAYIATSEKYDDEFSRRIKEHQQRRGQDFHTCEEPRDIDQVIRNILTDHDIAILECLTTWLCNIQYYFNNDFAEKSKNILKTILHDFKNDTIEDHPIFNYNRKLNNSQNNFDFLKEITAKDKVLIIISNETGFGIVPDNKLSRDFRDHLGTLNQITALSADHVFFVVSGIPNKIK